MTFTSRGVLVRWNHLDGMQEELDFPPADTSFDILDGNTDISSALTGVEWSKPATASQQHAIFFDFINKLYTLEDPTAAYLTYVSLDYINHSPYAPQGRAAAIAFLVYLIPSVNRTIVHETFDGGIGFVHLNVAGGQMAVADAFRLDGTCVMEHWDVDQAKPANATNPLSLF